MLKDESCRYQWQSIWALVSVVGKRLEGLVATSQDREFDVFTETETEQANSDTIMGTLLFSSEIPTILNLSNVHHILESTHQTYSVDLALALAIHAVPTGLSARPHYIYPTPLSPNVVKSMDKSTCHVGSTNHLMAGIMVLPSTTIPTQFQFGAWLLDPSTSPPSISTFGIAASQLVSLDLPSVSLHEQNSSRILGIPRPNRFLWMVPPV